MTTRRPKRLGHTVAAATALVAAAVLCPPRAQPFSTVSIKPSAMTFRVRDAAPPPGSAGGASGSVSGVTGSVTGVRSPVEAGSTLNLVVNASEAGGGLASAQASIDGHGAAVSLCPAPAAAGGSPGGGCPESVSEVPLSIGVGREGAYQLLVSVTDVAGNTTAIATRTIEVLPPVPPAGNTITVGITAIHGGPPGGSSPEGGVSEGQPRSEVLAASSGRLRLPVCPSPMLEMSLASRPLGYTRGGLSVLRLGRRYRFAGRLTCLDGRRRVSAPDGTQVGVRYEHGGCAFGRRVGRRVGRRACTPASRWHTATVHRGRLSVRVLIVGRGTVVFGYRPSDGESVQVSLPVAVARGRGRSGRRR